MTARLWKEWTFGAAHRLPHVGPDPPCGRLHGHTDRLRIEGERPIDPRTGWIIYFGALSRLIRPGEKFIGRSPGRRAG